MLWRGCQAASRCHQNRIGPEAYDLHHHGDSHHTVHIHRKRDKKRHYSHRRERDKDIIQTESDMRWGWTPAGWGTRSKTSGNGTDSQGSRAVPGWVLVQQEMPDRQERTGGENRERRERGTQLWRSCACGTNKQKVREIQWFSEQLQ